MNKQIRPLFLAVMAIYNRAFHRAKPNLTGRWETQGYSRRGGVTRYWSRTPAAVASLLAGLAYGMQPTECQQSQAVQTAAGTTISISATAPDTFDAAGYQSTDIIWAAIGEITDGGTHGRKYAEVTHKPIGSRGTQVFKGSFDEGSKTIQMGLDIDDAGQVVCRAALLSDNNYSFKVDYPNGDFDFFQAKVMSFEKQTSNVDSIVNATMMIRLTTSSTGVGIVEVNGA